MSRQGERNCSESWSRFETHFAVIIIIVPGEKLLPALGKREFPQTMTPTPKREQKRFRPKAEPWEIPKSVWSIAKSPNSKAFPSERVDMENDPLQANPPSASTTPTAAVSGQSLSVLSGTVVKRETTSSSSRSDFLNAEIDDLTAEFYGASFSAAQKDVSPSALPPPLHDTWEEVMDAFKKQ